MARKEALPLVRIHDGGGRHAAIPNRDAFRPQPARLFAEVARRFGEHDATAGADDPMPRNVHCLRGHSQGEPCLACTTRQSAVLATAP